MGYNIIRLAQDAPKDKTWLVLILRYGVTYEL
jgi:hypothetical protein